MIPVDLLGAGATMASAAALAGTQVARYVRLKRQQVDLDQRVLAHLLGAPLSSRQLRGAITARPHRHRRFPLAWWIARCKCPGCNRVVDYDNIAALEKECEIHDYNGELVFAPLKVGDQRGGRTVVCINALGEPVWDKLARPAPPRPDPGQKQRV